MKRLKRKPTGYTAFFQSQRYRRNGVMTTDHLLQKRNIEKTEKQPKTYSHKRKIISLTFLLIFKRSWLRVRENIMFALPRTLIQNVFFALFF